MSLKRLPENAKSNFDLQLFPKRTFISGSTGITGSVYVFPNRSFTQKDNVDERLEFAPILDGRQIKPFDGNSLEARRKEIYSGDFTTILGGPFVDNYSIQYLYDNNDTLNTTEYSSSAEIISDISSALITDGHRVTQYYGSDNGATGKSFTYSSNLGGYWTSDTGMVFNRLPDNALDTSTINYEPALALLLDGADPLTEDHAWRHGLDPTDNSNWAQYGITLVNDSLISTTGDGVFTGMTVSYDELGVPFSDRPVRSKEELNPWPPEVHKWNSVVNSQFITKGYSDLSMHPRNSTKKNIKRLQSNHEFFSEGSTKQRAIKNLCDITGEWKKGFFTENKHCLSLSTWLESDGATVRYPQISYPNTSDRYNIVKDISTSEGFTIEAWVNPDLNSTSTNTVICITDAFKLVLNPYVTSNGTTKLWKVALYSGNPWALVIESNPILFAGKWHNIKIRHGSKFNNGEVNIFIDDILDATGIGVSWAGTSGTSLTIGHENTGTVNFCTAKIALLRCWNRALTQQEMRDYSQEQYFDSTEFFWYFDFQFDYNETFIGHLNRFDYEGNIDADNSELFYSNGTVSTPSDRAERVQYDLNSGHVVGMPKVQVHQHLIERVQNVIPTIDGFAEISTDGPNEMYPEYKGLNSTDGMPYFIEAWESFSWLKVYNSIIQPSDCEYTPDYSINSGNWSKEGTPRWIKYYGKGIDVGDLEAPNHLAGFFDDEVYTLSESSLVEAGEDGNDETAKSRYDYLTTSIWDKLSDNDFLPPHSVIFDIPQIFYGTSIRKNSLRILGNVGEKEVTLLDLDGTIVIGSRNNGAKVGVIDYEKGLICIFSPLLSDFGSQNFEFHFDGSKDLHMKQFDIKLDRGEAKISSNGTWKSLVPTANANDNEKGIVVISEVNLHDNNLNVIARAKLATPIVKRKDDSFLYRLKLDF
jgi:hypothetical protein